MRESRTPAVSNPDPDACMTDAVTRNAIVYPDAVCFLTPTHDDGWREVSAEQFATQVRAVAKGLIASGVRPGDRVALMCGTRYEWIVLDHAIWFTAAITVTVYAGSAAEQLAWILQDSGATTLIVETDRDRTVADAARDSPELQEILQIDAGAIDQLIARGADIGEAELLARRHLLGAGADAVLVYTSGTTGKPKGVPLTHGNLAAMVDSSVQRLPTMCLPGTRTMLFLPLAHILAHAIALVAVHQRAVLSFTSDWTRLTELFTELRPSSVLALPRVFEELYATAERMARDNGTGALFARAADIAVDYSRALDTSGPDHLLRMEHEGFDQAVYRHVRSLFGAGCSHALCGGAPLAPRLAHFFRGAGIPIAEGYGLTETTAAITLNGTEPGSQRIGTVGRPIPGHDAALADDDELLVRGPVVFTGYWNNDTATAEAFTADWFHTGDLASIDEDGYITITGHKKEIIITAGGKNIAPAPLEEAVQRHPLIGHCMLVGDGKPYIAALITLDPDGLTDWLTRHNLDHGRSPAQLIEDHRLLAEIETTVTAANTEFSPAERIRKYHVLTRQWSPDSGELTPKMTVRRPVVLTRYRHEIEQLYDDHEQLRTAPAVSSDSLVTDT
ncbi:long-chain-fatty-acid--CoA ligase FadD15 [Nocardia neocaledoniensis NBRC 108232]|uniref:Long-chain acyl-CoA synthetase n=1 Tax=Nocardia neocaledoniensis TaxID=236511 RepID=A0A317N6X1_9NOCA|nr:long-chain fatty acid--CoA ligase [Nocardia neocaledoniensis]PWV71021.1 long-chain acyl-CoA synthetase [Nocardia neocaledoniensis]GEM30317.1 long-chain-fatty-acid--CoA ligase FadD15 [Nocardia neocaledoniensis NBRC 108232]